MTPHPRLSKKYLRARGTIEIRVEAAMISTNSNEGQARDPFRRANAVVATLHLPVTKPPRNGPGTALDSRSRWAYEDTLYNR